MFWLLVFIGCVTWVVEYAAARSNRITRNIKIPSLKWLFVYRWRWLFGVFFGLISVVMIYPFPGQDGAYLFVGFPFIAGALGPDGRDYLSAFTPFAFLANGLVWYFFPQLLLWIWQRTITYRKNKKNGI